MNAIRYKISDDIKTFVLAENSNGKGKQTRWEREVYDFLYLVDILETSEHCCKFRIYCPNSKFIVGWQSLDLISLHFFEDMFDGRFNLELPI